jgi:galactokinase
LTAVEIATLCQRAEQSATGVPCGIMDQLSIVSGRPGWATLIDCTSLEITDVPIPDGLVVEHRFISPRTLIGSEYSDRVAQCVEIEAHIGSLREATIEDVERLDSELLRRRARHVVTENIRVAEFARALVEERFEAAGQLMIESHRSLARDYETSTPLMDAAIDSVLEEAGVLGVRMTGGGFGGCIVVLKKR